MIYCRQQGFTIIELMITLVVASVLTLIATPSFIRTIDKNRVTTAVNDFNTSLALAKSEAVKRNRSIKIISNTANWVDGYSIGVDLNNDDDFADTGESTIKIVAAAATNITIAPNPNPMAVVEINNLGGMNNAGSFVFDSTRYACTRTINMTASGVHILRKEQEPCSN